jgi:hypothetical protein
MGQGILIITNINKKCDVHKRLRQKECENAIKPIKIFNYSCDGFECRPLW